MLHSTLKDLDPSLKNHALFTVPKKLDVLFSTKSVDIGKYAYKTLQGDDTQISLEKNKKYLLDFWFVGCKPCVQDHMKFLEKPNLLADNNIELIGLSVDKDHEKWSKFVTKKSYPWKNYRQADHVGSMTEEFLISIFPTYYLINGDGVIEAGFNGFQDIENYLSK